jgi:hypothetical protein
VTWSAARAAVCRLAGDTVIAAVILSEALAGRMVTAVWAVSLPAAGSVLSAESTRTTLFGLPAVRAVPVRVSVALPPAAITGMDQRPLSAS